MAKKIKKRIKGGGIVYPCKGCGLYPVWGSGFLLCENCKDGYESDVNFKGGEAVRSWNKENDPKKKGIKNVGTRSK